MIETIESDLRSLDEAGRGWPTPKLLGSGHYLTGIPVSTLASAAVSAAVSALQSLCGAEFGQVPDAAINAPLVDQWCKSSVAPQGWPLPSKWDPFARDYKAGSGWIRLHTNAPHHLAAALKVLGDPATPGDAALEIRRWDAERLEREIVEAGGCAARLNSAAEWHVHPQGLAVAAEPIVIWDEAPPHRYRWRSLTPARPLLGLRVLDMTRVLAGPVATRFLASLGADVLRVDPPHWEEDGNALEMTVGKTCAGLDLRNTQDRAKFRDLICSADIFVHGLRADALEKLGFGTDACRGLNPGLITIGLNAYGWSGPWANRRGFDSLVQRSTGLAVERNSEVSALPYQVLDHATGYLMAAAAIHGLRRQRASGQVLSARLSLARQAKLLAAYTGLVDTPVDRAITATSIETDSNIEQTDWGVVRRLQLPYQIENVEAGWTVGAHRLRTDAPAWRQDTDIAQDE